MDDKQDRLGTIERIVDRYVLTDDCLQHLKSFVDLPSKSLSLYNQRKWKDLALNSTVGVIEQSHKVRRRLSYLEILIINWKMIIKKLVYIAFINRGDL